MQKKHIITVDLGGTKILSALLNNKKEILAKEEKYPKGKKCKKNILLLLT